LSDVKRISKNSEVNAQDDAKAHIRPDNSREVATSEAAQLAERRNSAWIETSSKTDTNISTLCACSYTDIRLGISEEVFEICIQEIEKASCELGVYSGSPNHQVNIISF
jgi:hypothetical protein